MSDLTKLISNLNPKSPFKDWHEKYLTSTDICEYLTGIIARIVYDRSMAQQMDPSIALIPLRRAKKDLADLRSLVTVMLSRECRYFEIVQLIEVYNQKMEDIHFDESWLIKY